MDALNIIIRFFITFALSVIFGIERQRSHKPIGFGTFIFVSLGSCALGIIASSNGLLNSIGLLGATVTGIGFLGAGALIRGTDKVFGFTTASAIWLFAIFGLTIGIGEYFVGGVTYALVWAVVAFDRHLEKGGMGSYQKKLTLITNKIINEKELKKYFITYTRKHKILSVDIDKKSNKTTLTYIIEGSRSNMNKLMREIYKESWLEFCRVE